MGRRNGDGEYRGVRQSQLLALRCGLGMPLVDAARVLGISRQTAHNHMRMFYRRLGIDDTQRGTCERFCFELGVRLGRQGLTDEAIRAWIAAHGAGEGEA